MRISDLVAVAIAIVVLRGLTYVPRAVRFVSHQWREHHHAH